MSRPHSRVGAIRCLIAGLAVMLSACGGSAVDNSVLLNAARNHVAAEVTVSGTVTRLLADGNGSDGLHQRFEIDVSGLVVEIDHNLSLAPRVPVAVGDTVTVQGQFEPDPGHPVIHYTHHATGRHSGGYIELNGQSYS